jgi:hypothetical protein
MRPLTVAKLTQHDKMREFRLPLRSRWYCVLLGYYAANSGNFLPMSRDNLSVRNYHYSLRNSPKKSSSRSVILLATCETFNDVKCEIRAWQLAPYRLEVPCIPLWDLHRLVTFLLLSCFLLAHIFNYKRKSRLRVRRSMKCGWNSSRYKRSPKRPDRRWGSPNLPFNRYQRSGGRGMELTFHLRPLLR